MNVKKILEHNSQQFLEDLKRVGEIMVIPIHSNVYLKVIKKEVKRDAEVGEIHYYITDKIYKVKRDVMVIV